MIEFSNTLILLYCVTSFLLNIWSGCGPLTKISLTPLVYVYHREHRPLTSKMVFQQMYLVQCCAFFLCPVFKSVSVLVFLLLPPGLEGPFSDVVENSFYTNHLLSYPFQDFKAWPSGHQVRAGYILEVCQSVTWSQTFTTFTPAISFDWTMIWFLMCWTVGENQRSNQGTAGLLLILNVGFIVFWYKLQVLKLLCMGDRNWTVPGTDVCLSVSRPGAAPPRWRSVWHCKDPWSPWRSV